MVGAGPWRNGVRRTHHETSMPHTFCTDQFAGEMLHLAGFASQQDDFQTGIVIKMSMKRGDDNVVMVMLKIRKFLGKHAGVVVVDQRHRSDNRRLRSRDGGPHQAVANEIAERLGAIIVPLPCDELIKTFE